MSEQPKLKPVEIILPIVKLRVEDLRYLRGLLSDGTKCVMPDNARDRLTVLGLIEDKALPPCPKEMRQYNQKTREAEKLILRSVKNGVVDWDLVNKGRNAKPQSYNMPKERKITVITKAGSKLIQHGTAQVQIQKGCR